MADKKDAKPEAPAPEQKPDKKKLPLMKILIFAGVLLAQTAGAYFLQKTFLFPSGSASHGAEEQTEHAEEGESESDGEGEEEGGGHGEGAKGAVQIVMIDEIIVNPAGTGGRRFLSTVIGVQASTPKAEETIVGRMALLRDAAITLLSSKSLDQLASIQYRDSLKSELKDAVIAQLPGIKVENIVFSTYVLQ
jgi:flagellar FliL protein